MVCVPCIVIPVFLYIWHRFLQPFIAKFWNPFGPKEDKQVIVDNTATHELEKKATCPFSTKDQSLNSSKSMGGHNEEMLKKSL